MHALATRPVVIGFDVLEKIEGFLRQRFELDILLSVHVMHSWVKVAELGGRLEQHSEISPLQLVKEVAEMIIDFFLLFSQR